ncbi:ABC transporter ATP-binding protein [Bacillus salitolerans]|uniref:ABC transporter ATP-binding protein n=1 Tax=Bacillus salitolerans TaxID=1437434 RepID=A0ABW4LRI0_9BACI
MIQASGLVKEYVVTKKKGFFHKTKERVVAVNGLDLSIHKGEIVGLLGLNGAGKTTTIKMLSTLLSPTSGTILVDGEDITTNAKRTKQKVNMIAGGERMLYWRLTGYENLVYFGKLYGLSGQSLSERIWSLLEIVGLSDVAHKPVEQYSKGMKQRLQIARGLINDPSYIFLDEPTLGLDTPIAKQLRKLIRTLATEQGKGVLLTTHYLDEVEELCDRVYIINKGELLMHNSPEKIIETVVKDYSVTVITEPLRIDSIKNIESTLNKNHISVHASLVQEGQLLSFNAPYDPTTTILNTCMENGLTIQKFEVNRPKLEDAIIHLAGEAS